MPGQPLPKSMQNTTPANAYYSRQSTTPAKSHDSRANTTPAKKCPSQFKTIIPSAVPMADRLAKPASTVIGLYAPATATDPVSTNDFSA